MAGRRAQTERELLVAQGVNWIETCGFDSGIHAEEEAHAH
jgi:hypothetical protein